jgi:hypothetical protein
VSGLGCWTSGLYRGLSGTLAGDPSPHAARIIPVPHDPALPKMEHLDLSRLRTETREAYLRLAAAVASPGPEDPDSGPPAATLAMTTSTQGER